MLLVYSMGYLTLAADALILKSKQQIGSLLPLCDHGQYCWVLGHQVLLGIFE